MARKDRTGNRTTREQRAIRRIPEMGYYLVVTDTEATERCYFTGLHKSLPSGIQNKLVIKVVETKTQSLIENGDEENALAIAQRKYEQCIKNGYTIPSQMCPCTTVHELVGEIRSKVSKQKDNYRG